MEAIIKGLKPNKMKKDALAKYIFDNQADIVAFYISKGFNKKFANLINSLYAKMGNAKFPEALKIILKKAKKDDEIYLDPGFAVIINGYLEYAHRAENANELTDIFDEYYDIIDRILKKRAKKLASDLDIDAEIIKELLVIAPSKEYISNDKYVGLYSQKMLRKLYILAQDTNRELGISTTKQVRKLFKKIFGEKLIDLIAVHVLLEKKEFIKGYNEAQLAVWNLMTAFALETIEKQDKKHISELLKYYASRRMNDERKQRDAARRISIATVNAEEYPRIAKVVSKTPDKIAKYL